MMREDNQLITITHISQLATFITGFGGLVVPLIIWATQKDKVLNMHEHGRRIVNFQISMLIYGIISGVLVIIFVGFLLLGVIGILLLVIPIINSVKASHGEIPQYPLSIEFIK
jgi:uncharacterized Tic20 family protein